LRICGRHYFPLLVLILLLPFLIASCVVQSQQSSVPSINFFNANPSSISLGSSAVLNWDVSNATSVMIDQGIGIVKNAGYVTVSPIATTTYMLVAANASGAVNRSVTISVSSLSPQPGLVSSPPVIQISVTPTGINPGGNAILSWNVTGASTIWIDNGIGSVPSTGARSVSPGQSTTYTLTASNSYGTNTGSVYLAVSSDVVTPPGSTTPPADRAWLGSTYTREYHYPNCSIAQHIPAPSRIWFDTVSQAITVGYHPCPICKPPQ